MSPRRLVRDNTTFNMRNDAKSNTAAKEFPLYQKQSDTMGLDNTNSEYDDYFGASSLRDIPVIVINK